MLDSTERGTDVIKYEFTITAGEYTNRKVWKNWSITEKTIPYIKAEFERALGYVPETEADIPVALSELYEKEVEIFVTVREANGDWKAQNQASINHVITDNLSAPRMGKLEPSPFEHDVQ